MNDIAVRDFRVGDLDDFGEIVFARWKNEIPGIIDDFRRDIYFYLVRYYFSETSPFNLAAVCDGSFCGALFAAPPGVVSPECADKWIKDRIQNASQRDFFQKYRAYLEHNRIAEEKAVGNGDALLLLFADSRRGAGKKLLAECEKRLRAAGFSSMLLWTDETCDCNYYFRHDFQEVENFIFHSELFDRPLQTWIFRKTI